ncbi:MAG: hypothetical protein EBU90_10105 [Proteobacteria bacterium]|nr:hypothetical protein [Pseudomonadota bacterium]
MQDMIISAVSEYGYDKMKYWVNSIKRSGFTGRIAIVAFNIKDETLQKLKAEGVEVYLTTTQRNKDNNGYLFAEGMTYQVPTFRHYFYWAVLSQLKDIRYVISTDISDVVFQLNPSIWLENHLGDKKLNYGCEGLLYKDEAWGNQNMLECFPQMYQYMRERPIYNAGSMAGEFEIFKDFSLAVSLAINNVQNPTPDQAGVNVMLSIEPYKSLTEFNDHDTNWACECGTTVDPSKINSFRPHLLSPEPVFDGEYVYTSKGEKYVMVHQYNRVPEWKEKIERKYG